MSGSMDPAEIERLLLAALPGARVTLRDLTGTRDHYEAVIVSEAFRGLGPVAQHRLVYAALGNAVGGPIHALSLKTHTPESWARLESTEPG